MKKKKYENPMLDVIKYEGDVITLSTGSDLNPNGPFGELEGIENGTGE